MSPVLSFSYILVLLAAYFLIYTRKQVITVMQRRINGLQDLQHLRNLLEYVPQHRGMANALLQGDTSFKPKLEALAKKINSEIKYILKRVAKKDKWQIEDKVNTIEQQWNFIHQNLMQLQPAESFELHTDLVKKLLFLTHDIGDTASLLTTQDVTYAKLANASLRKLPFMAEMLGQARGMGTGVATRGQCDANMRVKLTHLLNSTRTISSEVCRDVKSAISNDKTLRQQAVTQLQDNEQSTTHFLNMLEQNIINAKTISQSSTDYYHAGTEAIKHAFALLDNINKVMQKNLQSYTSKLTRNIFFLKATVTFFVLATGYFYFL